MSEWVGETKEVYVQGHPLHCDVLRVSLARARSQWTDATVPATTHSTHSSTLELTHTLPT